MFDDERAVVGADRGRRRCRRRRRTRRRSRRRRCRPDRGWRSRGSCRSRRARCRRRRRVAGVARAVAVACRPGSCSAIVTQLSRRRRVEVSPSVAWSAVRFGAEVTSSRTPSLSASERRVARAVDGLSSAHASAPAPAARSSRRKAPQRAPGLAAHREPRAWNRNSTRRFRARPSAVSFVSIGWRSP